MTGPRILAARLRGLFARRRSERELEDEVRFHLEMQAEDHCKAGMDPAAARQAALRRFGGIEPMKEQYRETRSFAPIENTLRDLRYAARTLRRSPAFTVTSIAVLALAIAAGIAMFSVVHAVLLRPLPFRDSAQLTMIWTTVLGGSREGRVGYATAEQWRTRTQSFTGMAVFDPATVTLTTPEGGERASAAAISAGLFPLLGVEPFRGRLFTEAEASKAERLVVISHRFWQSRFAASDAAIGASIGLDGVPTRIVGVLPPSFRFPQMNADVWAPQTIFSNWSSNRGAAGDGPWFVVGRLRNGVTLEQAQAEMDALALRLGEELPTIHGNRGVRVTPLSQQLTAPGARTMLWLLTGSVLFVFLIAVTNCAGLSLARSAARARELGIRTALGAGRGRIVGQLLAESLVLSFASGLLGLSLAAIAMKAIRVARANGLERLDEASIDGSVLGCALLLSLLTGILVGLAPGLWMARRPLASGRGIAGGLAAQGIRRVLVVTEFGMAIVLLAGAGLLVRSLWQAQDTNPGFEARRVLCLNLSIPAVNGAGLRNQFYDRVMEQVGALPGVESAGLIENLFLGSIAPRPMSVERASGVAAEAVAYRLDDVTGGFFQSLGAPLLRGRTFTAADGPGAPRVAVINQTMARRFWGDRDPLGQRFKPGAAASSVPWFTVVGVVGDMRRQGLEHEPIAQVFAPLAQDPPRLATLVVRTSLEDPLRLAGAVQNAIKQADRYTPVYGLETLESRLDHLLSSRRDLAALLTAFSATALLLAAIGIYGLIQYSVATRTHEIGIRMAVGAEAGTVFRMILGEGLKLSLIGLVLGLAGAFWLNRAFSSLLYGVSPADPLTFAVVSLILAAVSAAACYFPARRAMRIQPVIALRQD